MTGNALSRKLTSALRRWLRPDPPACPDCGERMTFEPQLMPDEYWCDCWMRR